MRSCGLFLLVACSAACEVDPSLEISVHHPASYAVARTTVKVYAGDDVNCSQIQYGDRSDAELAAITVAEVEIPGGGRLDVSRLGGKSIVARGHDAQQRFVTAGCRDLGEIAGETEVQIDTEPTAVVAIEPGVPYLPFSRRLIQVSMADVNGSPLDGMVSWQLTGPAGTPEQQPSSGAMTSNGEATIDVEEIGAPGPQQLRIRVPWAIAPPPQITGFELSSATTIAFPGSPALAHPSCDLRGHAGRLPTLVCLTPPDAQLHRDVVEISWQTDRYVSQLFRLPAVIANQFALFVDHDGSADEPVYIISGNATGIGNWYRLGAPGAGVDRIFDGRLDGVVYIPTCQGSPAPALVGVRTASALASKQQLFTPAGMPADATALDGEIVAGGCVADVDRREHQALVSANAAGDADLYLLAGVMRRPITGTRGTGAGFVAVETQGMVEKRFAGTQLRATGAVVFEAVLAPDGKGSFKLVERTELEAAAPPGKIIGGKLDGDGDTDLMWDLSLGLRQRVSTVFQVSLARRVNGAPLTALTSGPGALAAVNASVSDFLVGDLDGQRTDEMVVFTSSSVTIYSPD